MDVDLIYFNLLNHKKNVSFTFMTIDSLPSWLASIFARTRFPVTANAPIVAPLFAVYPVVVIIALFKMKG